MKRNRIWIAVAFLLLLAMTAATVIAVTRPAESRGSYEQNIIERVHFSVENTDFSLVKTSDGAEEYELVFTLTAEKTEADFYAVLHSVEIEGINYDSAIFQTASGESYVPQDMPLPAENGKAVPVTWSVRLRFTAEEAEAISFSLVLSYTSGITQETADEHVLRIPMQVRFE